LQQKSEELFFKKCRKKIFHRKNKIVEKYFIKIIIIKIFLYFKNIFILGLPVATVWSLEIYL
jgi:hypothetical protein